VYENSKYLNTSVVLTQTLHGGTTCDVTQIINYILHCVHNNVTD